MTLEILLQIINDEINRIKKYKQIRLDDGVDWPIKVEYLRREGALIALQRLLLEYEYEGDKVMTEDQTLTGCPICKLGFPPSKMKEHLAREHGISAGIAND